MSTHHSSAQKTTELDSDVRQHVQELFPEDHYGRVKSVSSPSFRGRNKSWVLTFVFLAQYSVMGWGVDTLLDVHRIDSLSLEDLAPAFAGLVYPIGAVLGIDLG